MSLKFLKKFLIYSKIVKIRKWILEHPTANAYSNPLEEDGKRTEDMTLRLIEFLNPLFFHL